MISGIHKNLFSSKQSRYETSGFSDIKNQQNSSVDQISFCGATIYDKFRKSFKALNISEVDFIKKCMRRNMQIGIGGHGDVFKIPIKGFENYVLKVFRERREIGKLEKVKNDFPNNNFGQPIAKFGEDYQILRKINSTPLSRYNEPFYDMELKDKAERYYKLLSNLPQKSYNNFIKQIKIANKQGYIFDPGNLGNIMIKGTKLSILDLNKHPRENMLGDPLYAIFYNGVYFTNPQILKNKLSILGKLFKASKKENLRYGMADEAYWVVFHSEENVFKNKMDNFLEKYLEKR